jgi:hypothetical protein
MHWYNGKNEPQWRRRGSQKHHHNQHLKKEKTHKAWIKNVVGQTKSLSNCGSKRNACHHDMLVIVGTFTSEDH